MAEDYYVAHNLEIKRNIEENCSKERIAPWLLGTKKQCVDFVKMKKNKV